MFVDCMAIRKYLPVLFLLFFGTEVFAQTIDTAKTCNFLGSLRYKDGKAKVVVKAVYHYMFRSPDEPILQYLKRHKRLKYSDYIRSCCGGTAIEFVPENCTAHGEATLHYGIRIDLNNLKEGTTLYLYCSVYKNIDKRYWNGKMPYFVIDNITLTKP